jgi:hypothetical protein
MDEYMGRLGEIFVRGEVRSTADLDALKKIITSTSPPVSVIYRVDIYPATKLDEMAAKGWATSRPTTWPED